MVACPGEDQIIQFVEGDLSDQKQQTIGHHLETCDSCRALTDEYRVFLSSLERPSEVEAGRGFTESVMKELEGREQEESPAPQRDVGLLEGIQRYLQEHSAWAATMSFTGAMSVLLLFIISLPENGDGSRQEYSVSPEVIRSVAEVSVPEGDVVLGGRPNYERQALWKMSFRRLRREGGEDNPILTSAFREKRSVLLDRQAEDGSWGEGGQENRLDRTARAVLVLLGSRTEQERERRQKALEDGLSFLMARQGTSGLIGPDASPYVHHAAATSALLEAGIQREDTSYIQAGRKGLTYLIEQQEPGGLWKVIPADGSYPVDGVSHWHIHALRMGYALGVRSAWLSLQQLLHGLRLNRAPEYVRPYQIRVRTILSPEADLLQEQKSFLEDSLQRWTEGNAWMDAPRTVLLARVCSGIGGEYARSWQDKLAQTYSEKGGSKERQPTESVLNRLFLLQQTFGYPEER